MRGLLTSYAIMAVAMATVMHADGPSDDREQRVARMVAVAFWPVAIGGILRAKMKEMEAGDD